MCRAVTISSNPDTREMLLAETDGVLAVRWLEIALPDRKYRLGAAP